MVGKIQTDEHEKQLDEAADKRLRTWTQIGLSAALVLAALFLILRKQTTDKQRAIAATLMAVVTGYWLKG